MRVHLSIALAAAALLALPGCEDLRDFRGVWAGAVSASPPQREGFDPDARAELTIAQASSVALEATVLLPPHSSPLRFVSIRGASADVLADLHFAGEPLRTYLGFLEPQGAERLLVVVSLFAEGRVELRVIRGPNDLYGVFRLGRR